jgi:hypothetical protein
VKNGRAIPPLPNTSPWHSFKLINHRISLPFFKTFYNCEEMVVTHFMIRGMFLTLGAATFIRLQKLTNFLLCNQPMDGSEIRTPRPLHTSRTVIDEFEAMAEY